MPQAFLNANRSVKDCEVVDETGKGRFGDGAAVAVVVVVVTVVAAVDDNDRAG